MCASHSASQEHLSLVQQILQRAEAAIDDLHCGPHMPLDSEMAKQLLCTNTPPTALHNNCSGKHAGMLLACKLYGWPMETYTDPSHPLQNAILQIITQTSGTDDITLATDGCGAPVFCLPMPGIATMFARFASDPKFDTLFTAMTRHPQLVGDSERIDTRLMEVSEGNLVAKVGAEGFLGIGNRQAECGLALKIKDGSNAIRDILVIGLLEDLGWLDAKQVEPLRAQPAFSTQRTNTQNRVVGHIELTLPWVEAPIG